MEEMRGKYAHKPVEIPKGKAQVKYFAAGDQWVPRGDVLRCVIEDGGPDFLGNDDSCPDLDSIGGGTEFTDGIVYLLNQGGGL
jgi:hypothetical protein